MHSHFSSAKHTVVHGGYLMRFPWKDDGTPLAALVLSPWFTRGWTAVEVTISKSVKVLFKNPKDDRMPLIKDLERDILANGPNCSLGHRVASAIVHKLRGTSGRNRRLSDLVDILKTRSNSWPRDRVVVAALLAGIEPEVEATNMQTRVMQQIVTSYRTVNGSLLIHGSPTIMEYGSLSWCPSNLFFGNPTILSQGIAYWDQLKLSVDRDTGALEGAFLACDLMRATHERDHPLEPLSTHAAVRRRINSAFLQIDEYLAITCSSQQSFSVIVRAAGLENTPRRAIDCEWVGIVVGDLSKTDWMRDVVIRIGAQNTPPRSVYSADDMLRLYCGEDVPPDPEGICGYRWDASVGPISRGYHWSIENARWEKSASSF